MKKKTRPVKKKAIKVTNIIVNIRQVTCKPLLPGRKHFVRVVRKYCPQMLTFNTNEELNDFLFQFDFENYGVDPSDTGTWIDFILTDVDGELFDIEELEAE